MASRTSKKQKSPLYSLIELVVTVAVAVGLAFLIQAFVVKPYRIPSGSMEPTLHIGQRILAFRLSTHPGVGDIVVFHPPGRGRPAGRRLRQSVTGRPGTPRHAISRPAQESSQTFIKRVVGVAGRPSEDRQRPRLPQRRRGEGLLHRPLRPRQAAKLHFPERRSSFRPGTTT